MWVYCFTYQWNFIDCQIIFYLFISLCLFVCLFVCLFELYNLHGLLRNFKIIEITNFVKEPSNLFIFDSIETIFKFQFSLTDVVNIKRVLTKAISILKTKNIDSHLKSNKRINSLQGRTFSLPFCENENLLFTFKCMKLSGAGFECFLAHLEFKPISSVQAGTGF